MSSKGTRPDELTFPTVFRWGSKGKYHASDCLNEPGRIESLRPGPAKKRTETPGRCAQMPRLVAALEEVTALVLGLRALEPFLGWLKMHGSLEPHSGLWIRERAIEDNHKSKILTLFSFQGKPKENP